MATQTPTQRSAAAKRAAATRKRNAAKRSAASTRASARRTSGAASATARSSAQRVLHTALGAIATAGDAIRQNALTYTNPGRLARQLDQFERRGRLALDRGRRQVRRRAR
jgi:hypothetical protein